jgi:N-acylglucosamine-6-phosphate 2-epimerase
MHPVIESIKHGLLVSCMATEAEPLHGPVFMAAMALCAEQGGAVGVKAAGLEDTRMIKKMVKIPVMGMLAIADPNGKRWVTPTFEAAKALSDAGADIIAISGSKNRTFGDPTPELIKKIHSELGKPVMVDVVDLEEAKAADAAGADTVRVAAGATKPDFQLLESVANAVSCKVLAEGGYWTPEEASKALQLGAWALVVGTAITRPVDITKRWVRIMKEAI